MIKILWLFNGHLAEVKRKRVANRNKLVILKHVKSNSGGQVRVLQVRAVWYWAFASHMLHRKILQYYYLS